VAKLDSRSPTWHCNQRRRRARARQALRQPQGHSPTRLLLAARLLRRHHGSAVPLRSLRKTKTLKSSGPTTPTTTLSTMPKTNSVCCKACGWWSNVSTKPGNQAKCAGCNKWLPRASSAPNPRSQGKPNAQKRSQSSRSARPNRSSSRSARPKNNQSASTSAEASQPSEDTAADEKMLEPQLLPKPKQIQRLQKLQQALILPEDQAYFDAFQTQIVGIKAAICAEKPLDQQIAGLEAAINRKQQKRTAAVEEVNRLTQVIQDLDSDIVLKETELAEIKKKKLAELNLPQQQAPPDLNAANQIQMLMHQVNQLQCALNLMTQQQHTAGGENAAALAAQLQQQAQFMTLQAASVAPSLPGPSTAADGNTAAYNSAPGTPGVSMVVHQAADASPGSLPLQSSQWSPSAPSQEMRAIAIAAAQQSPSAVKPVQRERRDRSPRRTEPYLTSSSSQVVLDSDAEEDNTSLPR
jgi:hypothetical protein